MTRRSLFSGAIILTCGFILGSLWRETPGKPAAVRAAEVPALATPPRDGKLRIIAFGAHPDDCELKAGGVGAMWAAQGHHVLFVSVTNGDIGHWRQAGGPLARRRLAEAEKCDRMLGIHARVLDIHDGELEPTLDHRRTITRLIRAWEADIVIAHRPNDYHPDHRYTGVLVQDAAFMVSVPFFCPDVTPLKKNPVFLYYSDRFERPNPFRADIVVDVDSVIEKKVDALGELVSQFYEGGALGSADLLPKTDEASAHQKRVREVRDSFLDRSAGVAKKYRPQLETWYGKERGSQVHHAEAFEICEYGSQPKKAELRRLFPFFPEAAAGGGGNGPEATSAEARLRQLKIELPKVSTPTNTLVNAVRVGDMLYVSGTGPSRPDGTQVTGRLGKDMDTAGGRDAARLVGLNILAVVQKELGSLDRVVRVVKTLGMVNAVPEFKQQPQVINGFSDLMVEIFGPEAGKGARSAVGMASLPNNIAVEVEVIFQIDHGVIPAKEKR